MADPADLDARAVVLQRLLEAALDVAVVARLLHVDEVDDDEAGEVAQAQLPGDLVGRLEVGAQRGVLDVVLARRLAGVDVDRNQRLGLVDDEVAARRQRHRGREQRVELALHLEAGEQRPGVLVGLHVTGVARHQHLHEVLGFTIAVVALDEDLVHVLGVEVADRTLDQAAFLVDEARRGRLQGEVADVLPQPDEVVAVALDLGLGALRARRAHDQAHPLRHLDVARHFLEAAAVVRVGDLARDAAAAGGVRHQHAVAPGERQVGGERGALVAALLLDDLDEQHLAALDDLLDLVGAARLAAALRHLLHGVLDADRFDRRRLGGFLDRLDAFAHRRLRRLVVALLVAIAAAGLGLAAVLPAGGVVGGGLLAVMPLAVVAGGVVLVVTAGLVGFLAQQRLPVGDRDLVVVGVDFGEGEEAVAVAAVLHERRLERGLDPRHLGEVDVALQLFALGAFVIELLDAVAPHDDDPRLLGVRGVDKHSRTHIG